MKKVIFALALATLMFSGCNKEKRIRILTNNIWEVKSIKEGKDAVLQEAPYEIMLTLSFIEGIDHDTFVFKLRNGWILISKVKIGNHKIDFESIDVGKYEEDLENSPFTLSCTDLLCNKITHYETDGYILALTGKKGEEINLTRKFDF